MSFEENTPNTGEDEVREANLCDELCEHWDFCEGGHNVCNFFGSSNCVQFNVCTGSGDPIPSDGGPTACPDNALKFEDTDTNGEVDQGITTSLDEICEPEPCDCSFCAHYKLDEASGSAIDAVNAFDLTESGSIGSVAGKISTARSFTPDDNLSRTPSETCLNAIFGGVYIFWAKIVSDIFTDGTGTELKSLVFQNENSSAGGSDVFRMELRQSATAGNNDVEVTCTDNAQVEHTINISDGFATGDFHLVAVWVNSCTNTFKIQIDNGSVISKALAGGSLESSSFDFNFQIGGGTTGGDPFGTEKSPDLHIDEWTVIQRSPSSPELSFIYNDGSGRTFDEINEELCGAETPVDNLCCLAPCGCSEPNCDFSIQIWIRPDASIPGKATIIQKGSHPGTLEWTIEIDTSGFVSFSITSDGTTLTTVTSGDAAPFDRWSHVTCWIDDSLDTINIQVNRNLVGGPSVGLVVSTAMAFTPFSSTGAIVIGNCPGTSYVSPPRYIGRVDELAIWNRVLTLDEILTLYKNGEGLCYDNWGEFCGCDAECEKCKCKCFVCNDCFLDLFRDCCDCCPPLTCCDTANRLSFCNQVCAFYALNEGADTDATDESHNVFNLTKHGLPGPGSTQDGEICEARTFNGVDQYFTHPHDDCFSIQKGHTIWGWFRTSNASQSAILAAKSGSSAMGEWFLRIDVATPTSVTITFEIINSVGPNNIVSGSVPFTLGEWNFVEATFEPFTQAGGSPIHLKINATIFRANFFPLGKSPDPSVDFSLAAFNDGGDPFDGDLDEWGVIERQLIKFNSFTMITTEEFDLFSNPGTCCRTSNCCLTANRSVICDEICAFYALNEDTDGDAIDASLNSFDLTKHGLPGPGSALGRICDARTFNGVDQYFTHPHEDCFSIQQGYSIWGWFKTSNASQSAILAAKSDSGILDEWSLRIDTATSTVTFDIGFSSLSVTSSFFFTLGKWSFVAAWIRPSPATMFLQLGGQLSGKFITSVHLPDPSVDFSLAAFNDGGAPFDGDLDEWGIIKRNLSFTEATDLFNDPITCCEESPPALPFMAFGESPKAISGPPKKKRKKKVAYVKRPGVIGINREALARKILKRKRLR